MVQPEMSGRELARTVLDICPQARVLFMTGYTGQEPLKADAQGRKTALLHKPFDLSVLTKPVADLLDNGITD